MVALYVKNDVATYFDRFSVEHIIKEIKKFIGNKIIKTNIYRIKGYDSAICGYFCFGFIAFWLNNIRPADLLVYLHQPIF